MSQQNQSTVMLADNFPAKAYLLITHLTESEDDDSRQVASFSSDGLSFEIYDQSIFAQKYLPQYFKHSNYGSFVRQLNLYGFTSSRLKNNNDVVVWHHDNFRRDRKDLVKDIKRAKKAKSNGKPSHVHVNPRSPSPSSASDDQSSENATFAAAKVSRTVSGMDQGWLESEFNFLKQQNRALQRQVEDQNRFLEQKLDTLLKITLRVSNISPDEVQAGEKRRRMSPVESGDPISVHHNGGLESIYEEQKFFDGDDYAIDPTPYESRKPPPPPAASLSGSASNHEFGPKDDSLKRFVDIMLSEEEEEEECKEDGESAANGTNGQARAAAPKSVDAAAYPPGTMDDDELDDELMEEAMNAMLPDATIDTDGDPFELSGHPEATAAQSPGYGHASNVTMMQNAAVDKPSGPEPVRTVSFEVPEAVGSRGVTENEGVTVEGGDIEEGGLPVAVIAAHAELVDDDGIGNGNAGSSQLQRERMQHENRWRRIWLVAFGVGAVLAVGVTLAAVFATREDDDHHSSADGAVVVVHKTPGKPPRPKPHCPHGEDRHGRCHSAPQPCPFGKDQHGGCLISTSWSQDSRPGWKGGDRGDGELGNDDQYLAEASGTEELDDGGDRPPEFAEETNNTTQVSRAFVPGLRHHIRNSVLDDVRGGDLTSFSITLADREFVCSSRENLF